MFTFLWEHTHSIFNKLPLMIIKLADKHKISNLVKSIIGQEIIFGTEIFDLIRTCPTTVNMDAKNLHRNYRHPSPWLQRHLT